MVSGWTCRMGPALLVSGAVAIGALSLVYSWRQYPTGQRSASPKGAVRTGEASASAGAGELPESGTETSVGNPQADEELRPEVCRRRVLGACDALDAALQSGEADRIGRQTEGLLAGLAECQKHKVALLEEQMLRVANVLYGARCYRESAELCETLLSAYRVAGQDHIVLRALSYYHDGQYVMVVGSPWGAAAALSPAVEEEYHWAIAESMRCIGLEEQALETLRRFTVAHPESDRVKVAEAGIVATETAMSERKSPESDTLRIKRAWMMALGSEESGEFVRRAAIDALRRDLGSDAMDALIQASRGPDVETRLYLVVILGKRDDDECHARVREMAFDKDPRVRSRAEEALKRWK